MTATIVIHHTVVGKRQDVKVARNVSLVLLLLWMLARDNVRGVILKYQD